MEWVGVAMVLVGAVLAYSGAKNLSPWEEFTQTLSTGKASAVPNTGPKATP